MDPGAGDAHVQQAPLLLDLLVGLGVGDRHHALGEADQEDGVPFEALGRVQRGEGDALDGRGVLGGGPLVEFGDQVGEGGAGPGAGEVLGEPDESGEGLPAVADGAGACGRLAGPALGGEDRPDLRGQVLGVVEEGVVAPARAAPRRATPASRTSWRSKKRSAPRSW